MSSFNVAQILPSLDSGGVERGTIEVANYLSELNLKNNIISNGGRLIKEIDKNYTCLLYTSPSPRDVHLSRMPSSA